MGHVGGPRSRPVFTLERRKIRGAGNGCSWCKHVGPEPHSGSATGRDGARSVGDGAGRPGGELDRRHQDRADREERLRLGRLRPDADPDQHQHRLPESLSPRHRSVSMVTLQWAQDLAGGRPNLGLGIWASASEFVKWTSPLFLFSAQTNGAKMQ